MDPAAPRKHVRHKSSYSQAIYRNLRNHPRRRQLMLESLEPRAMLAGDVNPLIGFRLEAADPVTLLPLNTIRVGEQFALVTYVRDLRADAKGVYSVYLDINFPAAQFEVSGPMRRLGGFTNGLSGTAGSGIIDEVGAFSEAIKPPGGAEQKLVAIPFIARQEGDFTFTMNPADLAVSEVLLHGINSTIPTNQMQFTSLTTHIAPGSGSNTHLDALNDEFFVRSPATLTFDVLANDSSPVASSMTIFRVDNTGTAGVATVSTDHRHVVYSPPAGVTGVDVFRYSVVDSLGESDTAAVTVHLENGTVATKKASFRVLATDRTGRPVSSVNEGDDFLLQVVVADTRPNPQGVFAAYVDVAFSPQLAQITGPLEFPGVFTNGIAGDRQTPGLIDDAGAFVSRFNPPGDGEYLLFQVPMKATSTGKAVIQSGPADILPDHQSLLFNENQPIDPTQIEYGHVELTINPAVIAVDDTFDIPAMSGPVVFDVLVNDQATSTSLLTITRVDTADLRGTVSVGRDGRSLTFTPTENSRGTERFQYTAANVNGSASAEVTVHLQPLAPIDDVLQIRLAATDLAGQALASVNAGDSFNIQAWVRDLRPGSSDTRGVYAAYFDLLYEADRATTVSAPGNPRGIDITFGPQFQNGLSGNGVIPGIVDEVGAFQIAAKATGTDELLLFTAKFQANTGRAAADNVTAREDTVAEFDVLTNDQPNQGTIRFLTDPADTSPESDVLLFDPVQPVGVSAIRFLSSTINVVGSAIQIADVATSRRGGKVTIIENGRSVRYEPPANYSGPDEFTYSLGPGAQTAVRVDVAPVNDAPNASSDSYVAGHQHPLRVTSISGVLANDTDVDRDVLQARLASTTTHGQLQLNDDGSFTYTPNGDFFGTDQFLYRSDDGNLSSGETTVSIEVAPPAVRIRLAATSASGQPLNEIHAGESLVLHAFAQDMRDATRTNRGVGAVYMDLTFDSKSAQPQANSSNSLGFDITFGERYRNVRTGNIRTTGLVDDVGALQTSLTPIGGGEWEVFSMPFQSLGPLVADDAFRVSLHSSVNVFDVLANENGRTLPVEFRARESGNSPHGDIVLYEPAQAIFGEDVGFGSAVVNVRNSSKLVLDGLGATTAGGSVSVDSLGRGVRYSPPSNFVGTDSFTYTVRDENGQRRTGTVTVQVVDSWSNEHLQLDANSDSFISTNDVLQIINELNLRGGRRLPVGHIGSTFFDVNRDGHATAIDALVLINFLSNSIHGAAEGEGTASAALDFNREASLVADDGIDSLILLIARDRMETALSNNLGRPAWMSAHPAASRQPATSARNSTPATAPNATETIHDRDSDRRLQPKRVLSEDESLLDALDDDGELESLAAALTAKA